MFRRTSLVPVMAVLLASMVTLTKTTGAQVATRITSRSATDTRPTVRAWLNCLAASCAVVVPVEDIPFVQWVRDLANADVSVLITQQPSGGGGAAVTLVAGEVNVPSARSDTLTIAILPGASPNATRSEVARAIRLVLVHAVAARSTTGLDVRYVAPSDSGNARPPSDSWRRWTFTTAGSALVTAEEQSSAHSGSIGAVGSKLTNDWRINIGGGLSTTSPRTTLSDSSVYRTTSGTYNVGVLLVRSLRTHWAIGALTNATHSDFLNEARVIRGAVAAEYDVFPYAVATHRELTLRYQMGANHYRYQDSTLFARIAETRPAHSMVLAYGTQSLWGSIDSDFTWSSFLDAPSFYATLLEVSASLTLAKGLALSISAATGRVHDQIYIRREALTDKEILAKQKALATNYNGTLSIGLTYTFGSILSSLVNARFSGMGISPAGRVPISGF